MRSCMQQTRLLEFPFSEPAATHEPDDRNYPETGPKGRIRIDRCLLALLLSLVLSVMLRAPHFQHDFVFVDEAWWANGAKVVDQGGKLYRDVVLDKNPPVFWYCAFLFKIFGVGTGAIHAGALLLVAAACVLLFLIGKRFFSARVGAAASLIYAVASTTYYMPRIVGMTTETLMVVFSTAALYSFLAAATRGRQLALLGAGLLSSAALLAKPAAITESLMLILLVSFLPGGTLRPRVRSLIVLLAGFALTLSAFLGHMWREGILFDWWQQAVLYGFRYVDRITLDQFLVKLVRANAAFVIIYAWISILILKSRGARWRDMPAYRIALLWLLSAFAGVILSRRFYANYFIQVMPPMALVGAIGLARLWRARARARLRLVRWACCAAFSVSFLWFHSRTLAHYFFLMVPTLHDRVGLWDMCAEDKRVREIAEYLRSMTLPDDRIFVWGSKPQIYFLADRKMATAYMDFDVADDFPVGAAETEVQEQTAALLRGNPPRYVVDVQRVARIEDFAPFRRLVQEHYDFDTQIHGARLYRLRRTDTEGIAESKDYPDPPQS